MLQAEIAQWKPNVQMKIQHGIEKRRQKNWLVTLCGKVHSGPISTLARWSETNHIHFDEEKTILTVLSRLRYHFMFLLWWCPFKIKFLKLFAMYKYGTIKALLSNTFSNGLTLTLKHFCVLNFHRQQIFEFYYCS